MLSSLSDKRNCFEISSQPHVGLTIICASQRRSNTKDKVTPCMQCLLFPRLEQVSPWRNFCLFRRHKIACSRITCVLAVSSLGLSATFQGEASMFPLEHALYACSSYCRHTRVLSKSKPESRGHPIQCAFVRYTSCLALMIPSSSYSA